MQRYTLTIKPQTAFATSLKGDTLFGQACWLIRQSYGEEKLIELLQDYTANKPFMVVSDALPQGYIQRPSVPLALLGFEVSDPTERKQLKSKTWLPEKVLTQTCNQWHSVAQTEAEMLNNMGLKGSLSKHDKQSHNSLNRRTGTTGSDDGFAPFQRAITWYNPEVLLTLQIELDEARLTAEQLNEVFSLMGLQGYGKEASCGLGKFSVESLTATEVLKPANSTALLTLAPCTPQNQHWQTEECYYQTFTRFGRHGDVAVHSSNPFKNPVLMADSYALLTPQNNDKKQNYCGQGITGISKAIPNTVHQGYAPVYSIIRA